MTRMAGKTRMGGAIKLFCYTVILLFCYTVILLYCYSVMLLSFNPGYTGKSYAYLKTYG